MTRRALAAAGVAVLGATGGAAAGVLADPHRRRRLERSARVWRLTARRGAHWAVVKVRGAAADAEARRRLDEEFAVRSAEDVARELGQMKGVVMKIGQLVSFIAEGLPPEAQQVLATLQADVPPMAPSLAARVVREELGADPEDLFLAWNPVPAAAASIGQVHRAVLHDGRVVAVKVQYPGAAEAIAADLDNADALYSLLSAVALRGLDAAGVVEELRARMGDEVDYHREAANQAAFASEYEGHPSIRIPAVVPELSGARVLVSEWAEGRNWAQFEAGATPAARQRASETIFRFGQAGVHRLRRFWGDPHPGNYRFAPDGSVTFLDFGLVKQFAPGEWEAMEPTLDAVLDGDPAGLVAAMVQGGFLAPGFGGDPQAVWDYVAGPYLPFRQPTFTFTRTWVAETVGRMVDLSGPAGVVVRQLNLPAGFVILNRVVWGVSAVMGRLGASGPWRAILDEYRLGTPPATPLGEAEAAWRAARPVGVAP